MREFVEVTTDLLDAEVDRLERMLELLRVEYPDLDEETLLRTLIVVGLDELEPDVGREPN